ncbi:hypothetical protein BASA60_006255 [Batrachochytrium salamandrivorans]|nr:hypothetical protein BASA62_007545 [Batrachochytrium salamandrivorans]KAH6573023.1 hypothetical protein BASA60_006255 [Batrachochytrium salamandrivorans]
MLSPPQRLLVLFGSQTGCAHEVADRIAREGHRRHLDVQTMSMDTYNKAQLPNESLVLFVCSVTGQGEEPDNMKKFWRFLLRKNLPADSLVGMHFGVFGLGDSSYPKFNFPAKKLFKRLLQLGATSLLSRGDGDDQHDHGFDGALDPWLEEAWNSILKLYPLPPGKEIISADILPLSSYNVVFLDKIDPHSADHKEHELSDDPKKKTCAVVLENTRITTSDHFQDIRHMVFDISDSGLLYSAGDVMIVHPQNLPLDVQNAIDYLGWTELADAPLRITVNRSDATLPHELMGILTLRKMFECHLDIFGCPRRYFFELLAFFSSDEQHTEKLREFASAAGQNDLYAYCHRVRRTTMEVLKDFVSVKVPVKYLFDLIPLIRPRSFSIASGPLENSASKQPCEVQLVVGIVTYQTQLREMRHGVCTKWMAQLQQGDRVQFGISRGIFRLPFSINTPVICIGVGTGIAPIRSILEARWEHGASENILFIGTRSKNKDFLFEDEWEHMVTEGSLQLFLAFSRDQEQKVYVQHRIKEQGRMLWEMINDRGAIVYLSGNSKQMPADVNEAFVHVFQVYGKLDREGAEKLMIEMQAKKRYQQECWS